VNAGFVIRKQPGQMLTGDAPIQPQLIG
jgi:hypothetical protein